VRFDGIAHRGAGAVGLDVADLRRVDSGIHAGIAHEPRLGVRARQRNAIGVAILVEGRADDHRVDGIAVGNRVRKFLQQHHTRALAADEAVRRSIEGLAFAFRRQHSGLGKPDESVRRDHHRHATRQRGLAATGENVLTSHMHGGQGGRTSGVHRQARSA